MSDQLYVDAVEAAHARIQMFGLESFVTNVSGLGAVKAKQLVRLISKMAVGSREFVGSWEYKGGVFEAFLVITEDGPVISLRSPMVWEPA